MLSCEKCYPCYPKPCYPDFADNIRAETNAQDNTSFEAHVILNKITWDNNFRCPSQNTLFGTGWKFWDNICYPKITHAGHDGIVIMCYLKKFSPPFLGSLPDRACGATELTRPKDYIYMSHFNFECVRKNFQFDVLPNTVRRRFRIFGIVNSRGN